MKKGFYTLFSTANNRYVYDAVTQNFLQVDPIVYDLIDDMLTLGPEETKRRRLGNPYADSSVNRAVEEVSQAVAEGMLLSEPVEHLSGPGDLSEIQRALAGHCHQLILEVTQKCNMRCRYCVYSGLYPHHRRHANRDMPLDTARKAVDFYLKHNAGEEEAAISFYGGEPLLRMDLVKSVVDYAGRHARGRKVRFNTTTNAALLTYEIVDYLAEHDFALKISLDGPAEIHDRYRVFPDGRGTYDSVLAKISRILEKHPDYYYRQVSLSIVCGPPVDYRELYYFFDQPMFRTLTAAVSGIDDPDGEFRRRHKLNEISSSHYDWLKDKYRETVLSGQTTNGFLRGIFEMDLTRIWKRSVGGSLPRTMHPNGICLPGQRRVFVDCSGVLHPCERVNPNMPIGTVDEGFDAERIREYIEVFRRISEPDCCSCWAIGLCSMCFQGALAEEMLVENKRKHCQGVKHHWRNMFGLFCSICEENPEALRFLDSVTIR